MGFSLYRATRPVKSLLQRWLSTGSQLALGFPLLQRWVLPELQVGICSIVDLHGLLHRLQGNLCHMEPLLWRLEHLVPILLH